MRQGVLRVAPGQGSEALAPGQQNAKRSKAFWAAFVSFLSIRCSNRYSTHQVADQLTQRLATLDPVLFCSIHQLNRSPMVRTVRQSGTCNTS